MKLSVTAEQAAAARNCQTEIQFIVDDLREENRRRETVEAELAASETLWQQDFGELDLSDDSAVAGMAVRRAALDLRRRHFETDFARRESVSVALPFFNDARDWIRSLAEPKNPIESGIFACHWQGQLGSLSTMHRENQFRTLIEIGSTIVSGLDTILESKRGRVLTAEERRSRRMLDGAIVIRLLSDDEALAGVTLV